MILSSGKHLNVAKGMLDLRELLTIVESGVSWWEQQFQGAEGVARDQAAVAIKELSKILDSLSQQLSQGRKTVRITTRLPSIRTYAVGCPVCGRGNRTGARFCVSCGSLLPGIEKTGDSMTSSYVQLSLHTASRSDIGQVRQNNEDTCYTGILNYAASSSATILLVADGMGGAQAGEEASQLASTTVQQELFKNLQHTHPMRSQEWQDILRKVALTANERIYTQAQSHISQRGMGTTLSLIVVAGSFAHIAHVGDSRIYLLNAGGVTEDGARLMQLSTDHTLVARLVDIGQITREEARKMPQRNMLYRALGAESMVDIDTTSQSIQKDDVLLLCSDGLTNHIEDSELEQIVLAASSPEFACDQLVALANQRGGRDNISVIVARVDSEP